MSSHENSISRREFLSRGTVAAAGIMGATVLASCAKQGDVVKAKKELDVKIGQNLLLWTTHATEEQFPLFEKLKATGFDGVEFSLGQGDTNHWRKIRKELDAQGLECTTITSTTEQNNPVSTDPAVRQAAVDYLKWAIDMAAELGSTVIGGPFHSAYKVFSGKGPTDEERKWCAEVLREAGEYAQKSDIALALEFINRFETYLCNTVDDTLKIVQLVDLPNVGIHYDTHHAHIEEMNVVDSIVKAAPHIKHVHISENNRGTPGSGLVRWEENFQTLHTINYDKWLVIEAFGTAIPDFASNIHIWRDFAPTREEIYREGYTFIRQMWEKYSV